MEPEQQQQPSPEKRPKPWYVNAYVLIIVFISAAAACVAGFLLLLLPRSAEIIKVAQWRMVRTKTFYTEVDVSYAGTKEVKDREGYVIKTEEETSVESHGWVDRTDPQKPGFQQTFDVSVGAAEPRSDWAGEYRKADGNDYVRFETLPERIGVVDVAGYAKRWLRFDAAGIRQDLDVPVFGGGVALTDEHKAQLIEELRRTPFLRFDLRLKNETLAGAKTYHYQVTPEILFFKDYFLRYEAVRLGRELTNKERLELDTFFANVTPEEGEVWVGRGDYYLYRIRLRFRYDDGQRHGVLSFTANFGRFNEPTGIAAPEGEAEDITGILESLLPGIAAHLPLAKEGKVKRGQKGLEEGVLPIGSGVTGDADSDKDGLSDSLEYFYRTDAANPDTDGDGAKDGDEVAAGTNPSGSGNLFDFGITDSLH